jgi:hypothetical protein
MWHADSHYTFLIPHHPQAPSTAAGRCRWHPLIATTPCTRQTQLVQGTTITIYQQHSCSGCLVCTSWQSVVHGVVVLGHGDGQIPTALIQTCRGGHPTRTRMEANARGPTQGGSGATYIPTVTAASGQQSYVPHVLSAEDMALNISTRGASISYLPASQSASAALVYG